MQPRMMHVLATCMLAGDITQVDHFVADFHTSMAVAIGLLQDMHCISLSIIEVAFETSPAVLVTFFQLCALQCMLHDPWNVIDLRGATPTMFSRQTSTAE